MKKKNRNDILITSLLLLIAALVAACGRVSSEEPHWPALSEDRKTTSDVMFPGLIPDLFSGKSPGGKEPPLEEKTLDGVNPLTGLPCEKELERNRPLSLMLNNIKIATPQTGISHADILYECTVEGAITRLMAVFLDYSSLPVTGSVRSSRDYFIDFSQAHDSIYAHCGGSDEAYATLKSRGIDNLDGTNDYLPDTYWRDPERRRSMGLEHSTMTSGEGLAAGVERKKYRTAVKEEFNQPLTFVKKETGLAGKAADYVKIPFSYYAESFLEYDESAGGYRKGQYGKPHIDGNTGEQLIFQNILVLFAKHSAVPGDDAGRIRVDFTGRGDGYYISNGKYIEIIWKKQDRETPYALYQADGITPLSLNPGKSYIALAPPAAKVTFTK